MTWHNVMKANWKKDRTAMKVVKGKMVMIGRKHGEYLSLIHISEPTRPY